MLLLYRFKLLLVLQLCFCTSWMFIMNIQLFLCVFFNGFIHPFFFNNFWLSLVLSGYHLRSRQIFRCGDFVGGRGCLRLQGPAVQWWGSEWFFAGKKKVPSGKISIAIENSHYILVNSIKIVKSPLFPSKFKIVKSPLFPGKVHQKGRFSMAVLVCGRVSVWYSNFGNLRTH